MSNGEQIWTERKTHGPTAHRPARSHTFKLVVILPALNEEQTIYSVTKRIPSAISGIDDVNVIVIDDGSRDDTAKLAKEAGAEVISHGSNRGLGAAFATGIDAALRRGADIIVNMDADGQFNPEDIPALIEPILDNRADFVTCSRFASRESQIEISWIRRFGNRMMTKIINRIIWNAQFTDVSCGFRAYSRETALRLNLFGRFTYTQESFIDLASKGIAMAEVPLPVKGTRTFGKSRVANNLFKYGMSTLKIILRSMRDIRPLLFFGAIACILFGLGIMQSLFVFGWWLRTGGTSGFQSLLLGGAVCIILGFLSSILALIADMLGRMKKIQEEMLYLAKKRIYD